MFGAENVFEMENFGASMRWLHKKNGIKWNELQQQVDHERGEDGSLISPASSHYPNHFFKIEQLD
jgi:hypothetical protein